MKEQPNQGRARGHGKRTETWRSILSPSSGKTWVVAGVTDCIFQRWPLSLWLWHSSHWEIGSTLLGWLWGQTYYKGWSNSVTSWGQIVNDTLLPGSLGVLVAGTQVLCLAEAQTAAWRINVPAHSLSRDPSGKQHQLPVVRVNIISVPQPLNLPNSSPKNYGAEASCLHRPLLATKPAEYISIKNDCFPSVFFQVIC